MTDCPWSACPARYGGPNRCIATGCVGAHVEREATRYSPDVNPTDPLTLAGPVAYIDLETTDGRVISSIALDRLPVPLLALDADGPKRIGEITVITLATVETDTFTAAALLADGRITHGAEEWRDRFEQLDDYTIGAGVDLVDTFGEPDETGLLHTGGKLSAVTVYLEGRPAFPAAWLRWMSVGETLKVGDRG